MHLAHPLSVSLCQVIVDRNDKYAFSGQGVQIRRTGGNESLSLTGLHLCDTSLVKDNTADQLHRIVLHLQHSLRRLANSGKSLWKQIIQSLSVCQTLLKLSCVVPQLLVCQLLHLRLQSYDFIYDGINQL